MKINIPLHTAVTAAIAISIQSCRMEWIWDNGSRLVVNTGRRPPHSLLVCRVCGRTLYRFKVVDGYYATDGKRM